MTKTPGCYFAIVVLFSCRANLSTQSLSARLAFSCASVESEYSLLYTGSDTVYFQDRVNSPFKTSFVVMTDSLARELQQRIEGVAWKTLDTLYAKYGKRDGVSFK